MSASFLSAMEKRAKDASNKVELDVSKVLLLKQRYKCCNSFYKDIINWNPDTGKPTFNSYAILRDAPKNEIIDILKILGFTSKDLE